MTRKQWYTTAGCMYACSRSLIKGPLQQSNLAGFYSKLRRSSSKFAYFNLLFLFPLVFKDLRNWKNPEKKFRVTFPIVWNWNGEKTSKPAVCAWASHVNS